MAIPYSIYQSSDISLAGAGTVLPQAPRSMRPPAHARPSQSLFAIKPRANFNSLLSPDRK